MALRDVILKDLWLKSFALALASLIWFTVQFAIHHQISPAQNPVTQMEEQTFSDLPVLVVSANDDPSVIRRCMDFGASGFMPKTLGIEQMRDAIKRVLGGGVWTPPDVDLSGGADAESAALMARLASLTPQQVRVLMMLSEGMLNKQIAYELSVSEATVKAHVSAILQKLGVDSRTQAVIAAAKIEVGQWPQAANQN